MRQMAARAPRHGGHPHSSRYSRCTTGRGRGVRLYEEAAAERAALHQERRRRHAAVGLGQAGGGIFFIVDALFTRQQGYDVQISFPKEGIGSAANALPLIKGAKNPEAGKKLIAGDKSPRCNPCWHPTRSPSFQPIRKSNEAGLAAVLKARTSSNRRRLGGATGSACATLDRRSPQCHLIDDKQTAWARWRGRSDPLLSSLSSFYGCY